MTMTPEQTRETAAEGWIYGHPMLENYRTLYAQAVDAADPRYVGGFGTFRHYSQPSRPENTDVVTPNNDTPYSWCWLDLRTEPWVVSVPTVDRYYVLPFHDLDTTYTGYVGARTTGQDAGDYLLAGPGWDGPVPKGIAGVLRADTQLVGCVGRTYLTGLADEDVASLQAVQEQYRLRPLSAYLGAEEPEPAPEPVWPAWREEAAASLGFFHILDFLLGFFPVLPAQRDLRERLAALGVDGTEGFDPAGLSPEVRAAMEQGIADGRAQLEARKKEAATSTGLFGTREEVGEGNRPPNAAEHDYTIHFPPDQLPKARFFWSATLYRLPERLLTDNPINRYSIGDRTPGLIHDADGGLTLYIQHTRPTDPD